VEIPGDLRAALEAELGATSAQVVTAARELSQRYRHGRTETALPAVRSGDDARAYAAYRMPATYAAVRSVLAEAAMRRPDVRPSSLLDAGGGPGTAGWAAVSIWPELYSITVLERDRKMMKLGRALAAHSASRGVRNAEWRLTDLAADWSGNPADLVVAAFLLSEVPTLRVPALVARLWEHAIDVLSIVEPGTPAGYGLVVQATEELVRLGASIAAPFPADWHCTEGPGDWCHFSARVSRTRALRAVKAGTLPYEDEKYSYVVASKRPARAVAARVVRHPQHRPGHVRLMLCTAQGLKHLVVSRREREAYRRAKDLAWGSAIELDEAALFGL